MLGSTNLKNSKEEEVWKIPWDVQGRREYARGVCSDPKTYRGGNRQNDGSFDEKDELSDGPQSSAVDDEYKCRHDKNGAIALINF